MKIFTQTKFFVLALVATLGTSIIVKAQQTQFSQYYASSLYLNPALAGLESDITFNSNFRSQWSSANSPMTTMQLSGILPFYAGIDRRYQVGGAGLSVYNDQSGDGNLRTLSASLTGAYSLNFKNELHKLTFGLQGGVSQMSVDFANLRFAEQFTNEGYNPGAGVSNLNNLSTKVLYPTFNMGAIWSYNPARNYYRTGVSGFAGIAVNNTNQPNQSFIDGQTSKLPILTKVHGGIEFNLSQKVNLAPNVLFATQNGINQYNVGAYLSYKLNESPFGLVGGTDVILGGWYRVQDAAIASIAISNNAYTLGFSYDANTSSLRSYTQMRGAYEFSFAIRNAKDNNKRRRFDTPRI